MALRKPVFEGTEFMLVVALEVKTAGNFIVTDADYDSSYLRGSSCVRLKTMPLLHEVT